MWFILLLKAYWKELAIFTILALVFYSGWHLRGEKDELKAFEESKKAEAIIYDTSKQFEMDRAKLEEKYNNIDLKATYENSYSCVIPVNGLRILSEATK